MNKQLLKDALGWGFSLWLMGYLLGMVLFFSVPLFLVGWIILPIATVITWWVLTKKIKTYSFSYYVKIALLWTVIAIVLDYLFIVVMLKPPDGYYKPDVYLYYAFTFILPLIIGWRKKRSTP